MKQPNHDMERCGLERILITLQSRHVRAEGVSKAEGKLAEAHAQGICLHIFHNRHTGIMRVSTGYAEGIILES